MAVMGQHGWSVTFGTQGGTYKLVSVNGISITRSPIQTTDHSTTGQRTYIFETLTETGEVTLGYHFEPGATLPTFTTSESITLTAPIATTGNTAGYFAGTGAVTGFVMQEGTAGATDTQQAEVTVKFDGATDLAWTAEA